ncbi:hypothetical protein [Candidatus Amarolinea dominans]|uniref:hypothetical protein n=1 Tax=Candidatus Amarolinea dominans TaxID=3140696 RepID=UPI0031362BAB|nr:hypothetical protein [Anaerolineae bacterium]
MAADDQLFQNGTIPTNQSSGVLSFWYWSSSSETGAGRDHFTSCIRFDPNTGDRCSDAFYI